MNKYLGDFIYQTVLRFGFEIRRRQEVDKFKWLKEIGIDTIIDIGANEGQFADFLRRLMPDAMMYSFEPLKDCYEALLKNRGGDPRFRAFNLAISDQCGEVPFYRSSFSQSSSILPSDQLHKENFPFAAEETLITVHSVTLDSIASELSIGKHLLIKIDVQGVEEKVFSGGGDTLQKADIVFLETNFQPLYASQFFFKESLDRMYDMGFRYMGNITEQLLSPINGTCLEEDSVFINDRFFDKHGRFIGRDAP